MKILMITSYLPYPLFGGGEIRTYNLLKKLKEKHKITLISYIRPTNTQRDINEVKKFCHEVITLSKQKTWTIKNILRTGFSTMPLLLTTYHSKKDTRIIRDVIRQNSFDLIHVEPFYIMHNVPITKVPILLVEHNIEYLVYRRYVNQFPFLPLRPILNLDVVKMKEWEEVMWKRANHVTTVSESDKKIIEATGIKNVEVIPNGVDLNYFQFTPRTQVSKKPVILYVGDMRWFENRDAVSYLLKEIWPGIKSQIPNVRLLIVGRDANKYFTSKAGNSVSIIANVPDIKKFYPEADCLLAPIRKGGGTKYKILEAMACGLPVVTTSIGQEGLDIEDEKQAKIADTKEELIQATIEVLTNQYLRNSLAKNARELVEKNYSWDNIAQKLDVLYSKVITET